MNRSFFGYPSATLVAWAVAAALAVVHPPRASAQSAAPKLTVMIVVDQLGEEAFEHYTPAFEHGFRRMLDEGYQYTQASHAHARTSTAPGHATLSTGVFPARSGIIANSWQQRRGVTWKSMYAVEDLDSPILGLEQIEVLEGRSPRNLIREALPDWFAEANEHSRRVSISRKDRAAIPMGGRHTEYVYWVITELARFVTSTYYADKYPGWLDDFNRDVMPGIAAPEVWNSEVPEMWRSLARQDSASYEFDGIHTAFPHVSAAENASDTTRMQHNVWGFEQPRADDAVLALAKVVIDELELGQRNDQDYLALSFSANDRVGHAFGPYSQEGFSTLLHVDKVLGELFDYLDQEVGEGNWVAGLSGDHGVVMMPEYARELGNPDADRIDDQTLRQQMSQVLTEAARGGGNPDELAERVAEGIVSNGLADQAYTHYDLTRGEAADSFAVLYRNSYYPGRAWDDLSRWGVDLRHGEGDFIGAPTGTNHETPYWYDRHVPIMLLGAGVAQGSSDTPVFTVDFAPTLAGLAGIPVPDDLDGRRIY